MSITIQLDKDRLADGTAHWGVNLKRDTEELYIPCRFKEEAKKLQMRLWEAIQNDSAEMALIDER